MGGIRKKHLLWAGGVCLAVGIYAAIVGAIIGAFHYGAEVARNAYATWAAGELVCEHLRRNNNQWPRNWAELAKTYEIATRESPETKTETNGSISVAFLSASFDDISNRVTIDWTADVQSLQSTVLPPEGRPFNVITLKNGRMRAWEGSEPNTMVWEYLQTLKSQPAQP